MNVITEAPEGMTDDEDRCEYIFVWIGEPTEVYCGRCIDEIVQLHYERTGELAGDEVDYGYLDKDAKVKFHDGQVLAYETIGYYNIGHGIKMPEQIMTQYF